MRVLSHESDRNCDRYIFKSRLINIAKEKKKNPVQWSRSRIMINANDDGRLNGCVCVPDRVNEAKQDNIFN